MMTEVLSNKDLEKLSPLLHDDSGLEDGGKTILQCSSCGKPLIDIWVTQPNSKILSEIYAECPYCGDFSFTHQFEGKFCIGHMDDTVITDIEEQYCEVEGVDGVIRQKIKVIVIKEK